MADVGRSEFNAVLLLVMCMLCGCATTEELFPEYDEHFCTTVEELTPKQSKTRSAIDYPP